MAFTILTDGPPKVVTLATTCTLVTTDGTNANIDASYAYISSDTTGASDIVRVVYSDSIADGAALPADGFHEIPASQLPALVPLQRRTFFLQGSSAFGISIELGG